ncbi:MAG: 3-phosphoshikimate 1-carboxyvinyltransferase [Desulfarculaceae bacterium]|nr:3-phosphoshikimate 1-carboxyvinyltransferase [Desulfarculaceae bacterium]
MKTIQKRTLRDTEVSIPGSKSISHRMIIMASLCEGESMVKNVLSSEDIELTISALRCMGAVIYNSDTAGLKIRGFGGRPLAHPDPVYLRNSGTSMRLLASIGALGNTDYLFTGNARMCERPMDHLLKALNMAGADVRSQTAQGTPPVVINGKECAGGKIRIDCSVSSQYLSGLLIAGAVMEKGLHIHVENSLVSTPYVNLTLNTMKKFQVHADKISDHEYRVPGGQRYMPGEFTVEPDLSNAGYFWLAGAVTGAAVKVKNVTPGSLQGDVKLIYVLRDMGCTLDIQEDGITVKGGHLKGVDVDMGDMPDAVPGLAVAASFAQGGTVIRNIGHLRAKECDRIDAVASQLSRMGITVDTGEDWMIVHGGTPHGAVIKTFDDHRIAMSFAVAGLAVEGVTIEKPGCVGKSFPSFWDIFDALEGKR